jgi:hypothetical protein
VALLFVVSLVSACRGNEAGDGTLGWRRDAVLPFSASNVGAPTGVEELAQRGFDFPLGPAKIWSHYLAYTPGREQVVVCDLDTGRVATIATRNEPTEVFDYAVGSGDVVLYAVLSTLPDVTSGQPVDWRIEAADLRSPRRWRIAAGTGAFEAIPRPAIGGRWIVWTEASATGIAVHTFDLRSGRHYQPAPPEVRAGNTGVTSGGTVVFDGVSTGGRDVFVVPADGASPPRQVTQQGRVQPLIVANGRAAWRNLQPDGQDERWTMVPDGNEQPVQIATDGRVVPGSDFLVAEEGAGATGLVLHPVAFEGESMSLVTAGERLDLDSLWDVHGDTIVWVTVLEPLQTPLRRLLRIGRVIRR